MNPPSLSDYKLEAYNLGSPTPDPQVTLKTIKRATTSKIPALKVKLNFTPRDSSKKRGRKTEDSDSESQESPPKKLKMDDKAMAAMARTLSTPVKKPKPGIIKGGAKNDPGTNLYNCNCYCNNVG